MFTYIYLVFASLFTLGAFCIPSLVAYEESGNYIECLIPVRDFVCEVKQ